MEMIKKIRLMRLSSMGHTVDVREIGELQPKELFEPEYAVLVAGSAVDSWFSLVQGCRDSETEVICLPSLTHGC